MQQKTLITSHFSKICIFLIVSIFSFAKISIAQQRTMVSGTVLDENGKPITNATISIYPNEKIDGKNQITTISDSLGIFTFNSLPTNLSYDVNISSVGYVSQKIIKKKFSAEKSNSILITLIASMNDLDEVVVVAYGTTNKRKITSSVSTLDIDKAAAIPTQSINDAIAGRVQGVIVVSTSGAPGATSSVSIRGGGNPLYVIDGFIRSANDFENLNPNDIDSYSILKDASATSLYGALGGNGVILVTTKKGADGAVNINYSYNQIFSKPTIFPRRLDAYTNLSAIRDVYRTEGNSSFNISDEDLQYYKDGSRPYEFPNTDWQRLFLKNYAPESRHDFSLSSGSKKTTYFASLSNYHQGSILKTNQNSNNRTTYRMNVVNNFEGINLKLTTGIDGFFENNILPASATASSYNQLFGHIQQKATNQLAYNEFNLPYTSTVDNPAVELSPLSGYNKSVSRVFNAIGGLDYEAHFLKDLRFTFNANYNTYNSENKIWNVSAPTYLLNSNSPILGNPPNLFASRGNGSSLLMQYFASYNKKLNNHEFDVKLGYESYSVQSSSLSGSRKQYQILFDQFVAGPTLNQEINGGESQGGARAGYLGKFGYNYKNKYTLDATFRRDGNDLLPKGKQWGNFYAISGGWTISEESFMKNLKDQHILDFVKLRASYGLTGTLDGISPFQYVSGYSINANAWVVNGSLVQGTSEPGSLPSTNFSWYSIKNRNLGLDFATLNNRLSSSIDYFYMRTTGFVVADSKYAATLGIGLPPINFDAGATRREGAEFNITWNDRAFKDFNYKIGLNFTYFNSLTERQPGELDAALKNPYTRISGTDNSFLTTGYASNGFYTNNQDLLNGPRRINSTNVVAGDLKYQDINGDGKIDGADFRRIGSNSFPRINYGLNFDLSYKGFFLNGTLFGSGNRDRYIGSLLQGGSAQGILVYNYQLDYWRPDNQNALFPRQVSTSGVNGGNNFVSSDFWIINSQFLRLKYFQLGYNFNNNLIKKFKMKGLRVFVSGTNLFTHSRSLDFFIDPESNTNNDGYPIQKTVSFGAYVSF